MQSSVSLRRDVARCLKAAKAASDPKVRKEMSARAFELSQRAEALDRAANGAPAEADAKQMSRQ